MSHFTRNTIFCLSLSLCCAGDDDSTGNTSSSQVTQWEGTYYQSIYPNVETPSMYTIELRKDLTAKLTTEHCYIDGIKEVNVRWSVLDDSTLQFHAESDELLDWFGSLTTLDVTMGLTEDPDIVEITYGDSTEGPTLGAFRRGTACLVVIDTNLGCGDGSYVRKC